MEIHTIGIDLGKTVFHLVGLNARGEVVVRKKCSRNQILRFTSNLRVSLIGMEACGGAHSLGRALREQGHDVRLNRSRRSRNLHPETACKGRVTKKDESAAHSIQARRSLLQQRPDTFAQTNMSLSFFACKNGGGPYIPGGRRFSLNSWMLA
jgi:transposase